MGVADKTLGTILVAVAAVIFAYYSAWVFLLVRTLLAAVIELTDISS